MSGEIRIIAGLFKGKKIKILGGADLRPTPNRLRESLFNVLQFDIKGAFCLDIFAGSGALGIEALSRGAENVVFIEKNHQTYLQLQKNLLELKINPSSVLHQDAIIYLQSCQKKFDIIFIDPPFSLNLWNTCIDIIEKNQLLKPHGLIYLESPSPINLDPEKWSVKKQNKIGDVYYVIFEILDLKS